MPYVSRNEAGEVIGIYDTSQPDASEQIAFDHPDVIRYLQNKGDPEEVKALLSSTDGDMIRVIEDVVQVLIDKNLLLFTDLPLPVQKKFIQREKARKHLNFSILDEEDDLLL